MGATAEVTRAPPVPVPINPIPRFDRLPVIQIQTGEIVLPDLGVVASRLKADVSLGASGVSGHYTIDGVRDPAWPVGMAPLTLAGTFQRGPAGVGAVGHAKLGDEIVARWDIVPPAPGRPPSVSVALDAPAPLLWTPLKTLLGPALTPAVVRAGHVRGSVLLRGDGAINGTGDVVAEGVAGSYDQMQFTDAGIAVHVADVRRRLLEYRIHISTTTLANGLTLGNLHTRARQDGETFTLFESRARAMGGTIRLPTTMIDVNQPPFTAVLHLEDVELSELLQLLGQQGISGSGTLSGTIPFALHADHLVIDSAVLRNTTQGTLRYLPLKSGTAEQIDNIALKALEDFRYKVMKMELDYDRHGNYVIKTRLEGHNPDLYDGHPIAFNLNITGTLPGLLRSSLVSGEFSTNILRSINKYP